MRFIAALILTAALALPAAAQTPVTAHAAFRQGLDACRAIVEAKGAAGTVKSATAAAGLVASSPEPANLQNHFFEGAARVDWWRRATSEGRVQLAYDPAKNSCNVFLMGTTRGTTIDEAFAALPAGWVVHTKGEASIKTLADGSVMVFALLPGDESKGVTADFLSLYGMVWILPPDGKN